jgi:hypothetical protein
LIRGRIYIANDTSDAHVALAWAEVGRGLLFPFLGSRALLLQHWQSLGAYFLIVCVEYGYEVLVRNNLYC